MNKYYIEILKYQKVNDNRSTIIADYFIIADGLYKFVIRDKNYHINHKIEYVALYPVKYVAITKIEEIKNEKL